MATVTVNASRSRLPKGNRDKVKAQIAEYLEEYLRRESRKLEWLVEKSGVDRTTIWRILNQKVLANEDTLRSLARVVGVAPLVAAGYSVASTEIGEVEGFVEPFTSSTVQIPDLADAELGFYLSQLGSMPTKTREIIKTILREEYRQLNASNSTETGSVEGVRQRPSFARDPQLPEEV